MRRFRKPFVIRRCLHEIFSGVIKSTLRFQNCQKLLELAPYGSKDPLLGMHGKGTFLGGN